MERPTFFVDVILPLALPKLYTYRVPVDLESDIAVGKRVVIQFGKQKLYTAIIKDVHQTAPANYQAKYILSVIDPRPVVTPVQFQLWQWISDYYMCSLGEVMMAALPSALKLQSETRIILNREQVYEPSSLSDKEFMIVEALELHQSVSISDVSKIIGQKTVFPLIKQLIDKGILFIEEELKEKAKIKQQVWIDLSAEALDDSWLKEVFDKVEKKAPRQLEVLMNFFKVRGNKQEAVLQSDLLINDGDSGALKALIEKNVFVKKLINKADEIPDEIKQPVLTDPQQTAYNEIKSSFETKGVTLLQGVTSSGKTEIYTCLSAEILASGKDVLYLVPEIALTSQLINRLKKFFGEQVLVYHSKFNDRERLETWTKVLNGKPGRLILGARSSVFLPYSSLGLVIVDEEHENSYKQYDPAPRYHGRDTAIYLSTICGAKALLGSATPALETYYNAFKDKFGWVKLTVRYNDAILPEIVVSDIKEANRKKEMKSHFSQELLDSIQYSLSNKQQVILFQNRRGYAPFFECTLCAWVPHCKNCDVSLTYHKSSNNMKCHYCGYSEPMHQKCGACGNPGLKIMGFGTEKIEDELAVFFPEAKIARFDMDSTRSKNAHQTILEDFEQHRIDIMVGTQMVTKGLDFGNVTLVGILNADSLMNYPDFRAFERSYQLMVQVSGRAGRKSAKGKVVLQTSNPAHPVITNVRYNQEEAFYTSELEERRKFNYPPFSRLIRITFKCSAIEPLNALSKLFSEDLKKELGTKSVLGPEVPLVARVKNQYLKVILIKGSPQIIGHAKHLCRNYIAMYSVQKPFSTVRIQLDIDPL